MPVTATRLPDVRLFEPVVHRDQRGFFVESYRHKLHGDLGLDDWVGFVQDNHSRSRRGVVRGMHLALGEGAAKLVRCARGAIFDVVVDLRRGSPTFGQWEGFTLDDIDLREVFVPIGFAHGFCTLSDEADVLYKQTAYYDPGLERSIAYDDPEVGIQWPLETAELLPSPRDAAAPRLREIAAELPFVFAG